MTDVPKSDAFWRWFGNSVIRKTDGTPKVMYHGTKGDFSAFSSDRVGQSDYGSLGRGYYFTEKRDLAEAYAELAFGDGRPKVLSVYLRIENPRFYEELPHITNIERSKAVTERLITLGYDGVIKAESDGTIVEAVAFDPRQIKSIDNRGTFDPTDPNILHGFRDSVSVADTILMQMGGMGRITSMTGAHSFVAMEGGVKFKFRGSLKANLIIVRLTPRDTYTVEFFKTRGISATLVALVEDVYSSQLRLVFEQFTGLRLSL